MNPSLTFSKRIPIAIAAVSATFYALGCGGMAGSAPEASAAGGEATMGAETMVSTMGPTDQELIDAYDVDVEGFATELGTAMGLDTGPDCDVAGEYRDRICDLSERICDIAGRHPDHGDVVSKCEDGRERCERARTDVDGQCG